MATVEYRYLEDQAIASCPPGGEDLGEDLGEEDLDGTHLQGRSRSSVAGVGYAIVTYHHYWFPIRFAPSPSSWMAVESCFGTQGQDSPSWARYQALAAGMLPVVASSRVKVCDAVGAASASAAEEGHGVRDCPAL